MLLERTSHLGGPAALRRCCASWLSTTQPCRRRRRGQDQGRAFHDYDHSGAISEWATDPRAYGPVRGSVHGQHSSAARTHLVSGAGHGDSRSAVYATCRECYKGLDVTVSADTGKGGETRQITTGSLRLLQICLAGHQVVLQGAGDERSPSGAATTRAARRSAEGTPPTPQR